MVLNAEPRDNLPALIRALEEYTYMEKHAESKIPTYRIDTHRHLGGSIPYQYIWKTIDKMGWHHIATDEIDTYCQMVCHDSDVRDFQTFLAKFTILDLIPWSEELIDSSIKAICDELEKDRLDYTWMDFSINKYMSIGWTKTEAIKFIHESFQRHRPNKVGLLLSIKYESERDKQNVYSELIQDTEVRDRLIGIDLVGDENMFDPHFHSRLLEVWKDSNKIVRAHVGEVGPARNIRAAIEAGVTNIAHGINIHQEADLIKRAIDADISFDLGLTSNLVTGVAQADSHPLPLMIYDGLSITIGTDDPVICSTNLDTEFALCKKLGAMDIHLDKMRENAFNRSKNLI